MFCIVHIGGSPKLSAENVRLMVFRPSSAVGCCIARKKKKLMSNGTEEERKLAVFKSNK